MHYMLWRCTHYPLSGFDGLLLERNLALEDHICRFLGLGMDSTSYAWAAKRRRG